MTNSQTFKIELGENCNQGYLYNYLAQRIFEYKPEDHQPAGYRGGQLFSISVGENKKPTHEAFIYHTKSEMIIGKLWERGNY